MGGYSNLEVHTIIPRRQKDFFTTVVTTTEKWTANPIPYRGPYQTSDIAKIKFKVDIRLKNSLRCLGLDSATKRNLTIQSLANHTMDTLLSQKPLKRYLDTLKPFKTKMNRTHIHITGDFIGATISDRDEIFLHLLVSFLQLELD